MGQGSSSVSVVLSVCWVSWVQEPVKGSLCGQVVQHSGNEGSRFAMLGGCVLGVGGEGCLVWLLRDGVSVGVDVGVFLAGFAEVVVGGGGGFFGFGGWDVVAAEGVVVLVDDVVDVVEAVVDEGEFSVVEVVVGVCGLWVGLFGFGVEGVGFGVVIWF